MDGIDDEACCCMGVIQSDYIGNALGLLSSYRLRSKRGRIATLLKVA
jgi:hypothetical protein